MILSNVILMRAIIFILALCGLWVAKHIRIHKRKAVPLTCPIGFDCNAVVHSDYSRFLGVNLEVWGIGYYSLMSVSYAALIFLPVQIPLWAIATLILLSIAAFIFSVYLTALQIFVLKKGCSWCLVSATISLLIFIANLYAYDLSAIFKILLE